MRSISADMNGMLPDMEMVSRVCCTDSGEADCTEEESRTIVDEEGMFWDMEDSQLQIALRDMSSRLQAHLQVGLRSAEDGDDHQATNKGKNSVRDDELAKKFPTLIPGLPMDLAEICLARVPWIQQPKLMTVCKTWAAYFTSDNIFAVRSQHYVSESLLLVLSVPVRLGPLRLTVFDSKEATNLKWTKPLAVFDYLGKWSGFLRGFRCAVVGPDLFIIGGRHDGLQYATGKNVWRFNFVTRKWTEAAPMHAARRDFACAVIDGKIYVAGGTDSCHVIPQGHGTVSALNSSEMYDNVHNRWTQLPSLNLARVGCLGVGLEGRFYVIGGGTDNGTVDFELFRSAEVLDPSQLEWKVIKEMWQSHVKLPRAVAVFAHSLFAVDSNDHTLKTYDEMTNLWSDVMPMPHSNTKLPSRSGQAERQQAMGGLPGDQLIDVPRKGLLWMGPCSILSSSNYLLILRKSIVRRGWSGNVAIASDHESPPYSEPGATPQSKLDEGANSTSVSKWQERKSYLVIGSGVVYI